MPPYPPSVPVTVSTPLGAVTGMRYQGGWDGFLGIPFASNPRFEAPVPVSKWSGVFKATQWGPACPQQLKCASEPHVCPHSINETGCLTLNIFRPSSAPAAPMPVMVFIVGGNYDVETANLLLYDGRHFAVDENVVVVTINYRLGAIGSLVLDPDQPEGTSGGYGIMDQQESLRWVQRNIEAFGGNPNSVTIFGQSAGASSVLLHLALASSKGLFHRAISESNPASIFYKDMEQAQDLSVRLAEAVGCTGTGRAACMRAKPWLDIAQAQGKFRSQAEPYINSVYNWGPVIGDASGLASQPAEDAIRGTLANADVPVMLGVVHDEAEQWIYQPFPKPITPLEFDLLLMFIFNNASTGAGALYPLPDPSNATADTRPTMATIGTHYTFVCSNRRIATGLAAGAQGGSKPAHGPFLYHYDHIASNASLWGANFSYCATKACHGAELPLLFGTESLFFTITPEEEQLGRNMRAYWAAFARGEADASGALAPKGMAPWPAFTSGAEGQWMRLETADKGGCQPSAGWLSRYCSFWDDAGYGRF